MNWNVLQDLFCSFSPLKIDFCGLGCGMSTLPLADISALTSLFLTKRGIYSVKNFSVQPNKEEFGVMRFADFMMEFDGDTSVQKFSIKSEGFNHYPFQLVEIDVLEPTNNKFLVDVVGYVTNAGRTTQQRTGSRTLDFYLANRRPNLFVRNNEVSAEISASGRVDIPHPANHKHNSTRGPKLELVQHNLCSCSWLFHPWDCLHEASDLIPYGAKIVQNRANIHAIGIMKDVGIFNLGLQTTENQK
nr:hypothetical protein [Tanacetum cinerariifolium]